MSNTSLTSGQTLTAHLTTHGPDHRFIYFGSRHLTVRNGEHPLVPTVGRRRHDSYRQVTQIAIESNPYHAHNKTFLTYTWEFRNGLQIREYTTVRVYWSIEPDTLFIRAAAPQYTRVRSHGPTQPRPYERLSRVTNLGLLSPGASPEPETHSELSSFDEFFDPQFNPESIE